MFKRDLEFEERANGFFVRATMCGDEGAMNVVMGYCYGALAECVGRWCDKKGRSRGYAEIVASVTLMKALAKARTFDPERRLMPWLKAIARRELINLHRVEERLDRRYESLDLKLMRPIQGKNARVEDKRDAERLATGVKPHDELLNRENEVRRERQRKLLDAAIRRLPDVKRQVVELYRAGKSVGVIACTLALPPARISKVLFDAKEELRRSAG